MFGNVSEVDELECRRARRVGRERADDDDDEDVDEVDEDEAFAALAAAIAAAVAVLLLLDEAEKEAERGETSASVAAGDEKSSDVSERVCSTVRLFRFILRSRSAADTEPEPSETDMRLALFELIVREEV